MWSGATQSVLRSSEVLGFGWGAGNEWVGPERQGPAPGEPLSDVLTISPISFTLQKGFKKVLIALKKILERQ